MAEFSRWWTTFSSNEIAETARQVGVEFKARHVDALMAVARGCRCEAGADRGGFELARRRSARTKPTAAAHRKRASKRSSALRAAGNQTPVVAFLSQRTS